MDELPQDLSTFANPAFDEPTTPLDSPMHKDQQSGGRTGGRASGDFCATGVYNIARRLSLGGASVTEIGLLAPNSSLAKRAGEGTRVQVTPLEPLWSRATPRTHSYQVLNPTMRDCSPIVARDEQCAFCFQDSAHNQQVATFFPQNRLLLWGMWPSAFVSASAWQFCYH